MRLDPSFYAQLMGLTPLVPLLVYLAVRGLVRRWQAARLQSYGVRVPPLA